MARTPIAELTGLGAAPPMRGGLGRLRTPAAGGSSFSPATARSALRRIGGGALALGVCVVASTSLAIGAWTVPAGATTTASVATCGSSCTLPADTVSIVVVAQGSQGAYGSTSSGNGGAGGLGEDITAQFPVGGSSVVQPSDTIIPYRLAGGTGGGGSGGGSGGSGGVGVGVADVTSGQWLVVAGAGGGGGGGGGFSLQDGGAGLDANLAPSSTCDLSIPPSGSNGGAGDNGASAGSGTDAGGGGGGGGGCSGGSSGSAGTLGGDGGGGGGNGGNVVSSAAVGDTLVPGDNAENMSQFELYYTVAASTSTFSSVATCESSCMLPADTLSAVVVANGTPGAPGNKTSGGSGAGAGGTGEDITAQLPVGGSSVVQPGDDIAPYVLAGGSGGSGDELGGSGGNGGNGVGVADTTSGQWLVVAAGGGGGGGGSGFTGSNGIAGVSTFGNGDTCSLSIPPSGSNSGAGDPGGSAGTASDSGGGGGGGGGCPGGSSGGAGVGGDEGGGGGNGGNVVNSTAGGSYTLAPSVNATTGYLLYYTEASSGVGPSITSATRTTFTVGQIGDFQVTAAGIPLPSLFEDGSLPAGVSFSSTGDGIGFLSGTPASGTGGTYPVTFLASNGATYDSQSFVLTVDQPPSITSSGTTTFTTGEAGSFQVTTSGFPTPALSVLGTLPAGVGFTDNGNGTGTLSGTPAAGTGGTYPITVTGSNETIPNASQSFVLTVDQPPSITSSGTTTFTTGEAGSFQVTTSGFPTPALSVLGTLPAGVGFTDNGNGTGTLSGTPAAGTAGVYALQVLGTNGLGDAVEQFVLTVVAEPQTITFTSAPPVPAVVGGTYSPTATGGGSGNPVVFSIDPSSSTGACSISADTVSFTSIGTCVIDANQAGDADHLPATQAQQSIGIAQGSQTITFTSTPPAPGVIRGQPYTVTATGGASDNPVTFTSATPSVCSVTGSTVSFLSVGTCVIDANQAGDADYAAAPTADQNFAVKNGKRAITSASSATATAGQPFSFAVSTTGVSIPVITIEHALPAGLSFVDNGNGTATIAGTPELGTDRVYKITIKAIYSAKKTTILAKTFTLTVDQAPAITSAATATASVGHKFMFKVNCTGYPVSNIVESGTLPSGVIFSMNRNGSAKLEGTPKQGTAGTYALAITASNGVGSPTTQDFTLTVGT